MFVNADSRAYRNIVKEILQSEKFAAFSGNLYNRVSCISNV